MADEPEGEALETDQGQQAEEQQGLESEAEAPEGGEAEEFDIDFGDGAAPAPGERETGLVKHLREEIRKRDQRLADAEKHRPQQIEVGEEPTLESCEYDETRFKDEFRKWETRRQQAEAQRATASQAETEAQEAFSRDVQSYQAKKAKLPFPDVDEVESIAHAALNQVQQAAIVMAADDPAKVFYALGKRPDKLAELSQIQNPLKLAAAVARLEGGLSVKKRTGPAPEEISQGNRGVTQGTTDKQLERLEAEANRSGNRTKVIAYKKQHGLLDVA